MEAKEVKALLEKAPEDLGDEEVRGLVQHYFSLMEQGEEGATEDALVWTERLVEREEATANAWILRGLALFWGSVTDEAEDAFQQALEHAGEMDGGQRLAAQYHMGKIALGRGDLEQARSWLESARETDPAHLPTLHDLGVTAFREGANDEALELLQLVVSTDPDFPGAKDNLARLSFRLDS